MSVRHLLRTGLNLGARVAPDVPATTPTGLLCLVLACYLTVRGR